MEPAVLNGVVRLVSRPVIRPGEVESERCRGLTSRLGAKYLSEILQKLCDESLSRRNVPPVSVQRRGPRQSLVLRGARRLRQQQQPRHGGQLRHARRRQCELPLRLRAERVARRSRNRRFGRSARLPLHGVRRSRRRLRRLQLQPGQAAPAPAPAVPHDVSTAHGTRGARPRSRDISLHADSPTSREQPHLPESPRLRALRFYLCREYPSFQAPCLVTAALRFVKNYVGPQAQRGKPNLLLCNSLRLLWAYLQVNQRIVRLKCDNSANGSEGKENMLPEDFLSP
jgi:hypothetical protein